MAIRDSRVVGAADRACSSYMSARLDLARTEVSANDRAAAIQGSARAARRDSYSTTWWSRSNAR